MGETMCLVEAKSLVGCCVDALRDVVLLGLALLLGGGLLGFRLPLSVDLHCHIAIGWKAVLHVLFLDLVDKLSHVQLPLSVLLFLDEGVKDVEEKRLVLQLVQLFNMRLVYPDQLLDEPFELAD